MNGKTSRCATGKFPYHNGHLPVAERENVPLVNGKMSRCLTGTFPYHNGHLPVAERESFPWQNGYLIENTVN